MKVTKVLNDEELLVPRLRFKEFHGKWENKHLHEIVLKLDSGVSVNSTDEPVVDLRDYGILKTSCISRGRFYPDENKRIVDADVKRAKLNPLKDTILISRMNTPQLVGESGYIKNDFPNLFIPDRLWMTIVDKKTTNVIWLSLLLSSAKLKVEISNIATGTSGSMKNISKPNFLNLKILQPSLPEQQKIASFLSAVDEKIQQLTRKKELLKQYKKGVIQQLFSGKLRFKDEKARSFPNWEVKEVGSVLSIKSGFGFKAREYVPNGIRILQIENVSYGNIKWNENTVFLPKEYLNQFPDLELKEGDIVLALNRPVTNNSLKISTLKKADVPSILYQRVGKLCIDESADLLPEYIYQLFIKEVKTFVLNKSVGSDQPFISIMALYKVKIPIPCVSEQTKIGGYLSRIDKKLESISSQITQTQTFKKGLLQQMFV